MSTFHNLSATNGNTKSIAHRKSLLQSFCVTFSLFSHFYDAITPPLFVIAAYFRGLFVLFFRVLLGRAKSVVLFVLDFLRRQFSARVLYTRAVFYFPSPKFLRERGQPYERPQ